MSEVVCWIIDWWVAVPVFHFSDFEGVSERKWQEAKDAAGGFNRETGPWKEMWTYCGRKLADRGSYSDADPIPTRIAVKFGKPCQQCLQASGSWARRRPAPVVEIGTKTCMTGARREEIRLMPTDKELGEWPTGDDPSCCRDHVLAWREMKAALETLQSDAAELVSSIAAHREDFQKDGYYAPESHEPERKGEPFSHQDRRSGQERRQIIKRHDHAPFRRSGRDRRGA